MNKNKSKNPIKIIEPPTSKIISKSRIEKYEYPIFCFKYLSDKSFKHCTRAKFFIDFLIRLQKLSVLGWSEIRASDKHQFGMESLPVDRIKPQLPSIVTPDVSKVHVFRATGDNHPFIGLHNPDNVFHVFFIVYTFGDIYDH